MAKKPPTPKVPKMGRPPKADRFESQITVPCHRSWLDAVEAYRAANGYRSMAEVIRDLVTKAVASSPKKG